MRQESEDLERIQGYKDEGHDQEEKGRIADPVPSSNVISGPDSESNEKLLDVA